MSNESNMNSVNKTLYIPLYGKVYVSKKNIIIQDKKAEEIWEQEGFKLKGKSKSKWLAYYMAMRSAIYDQWVECQINHNPNTIVLHIGCGMDSRVERVSANNIRWYDIDFPDVIEERRKYYVESEYYHMLAMDMRTDEWRKHIETNQDAIIVLEGVSMYFEPEELLGLLSNLSKHFKTLKILMDCYTEKAAKVSKYKNPINDVGVTTVYGYDNPDELAESSDLMFEKEYNMTPQEYIDELHGMERIIFKKLFAGKIAKSMYRMYEFRKE
ncbi:MAG: class I SAM-dependent methyltransferase [Lachnospiraceae bacterium]|nr:class I SAM-dependent methyltransferase [Lachnospiraceae bacterium]